MYAWYLSRIHYFYFFDCQTFDMIYEGWSKSNHRYDKIIKKFGVKRWKYAFGNKHAILFTWIMKIICYREKR